MQELGLPPGSVRARNRRSDYYPLPDRYAKTDAHDGMTRLLALLPLESPHKRIALVTNRRVSPLAAWAWARASGVRRPASGVRRPASGVRGNVATNKAKRQTIPAFRMRDRWMIAGEYR